jgi:uncharacterized protein involved in outer membrane biogenesis
MRPHRGLLWSLVIAGVLINVVLLLLGPGTMWINSFVHSDAFRHEVETKAGEAAHGTVTIKRIDFSFWSGIELNGLATKIETPQGILVSQVESVNCSYSLLPLLHRQLQFNAVTLVRPEIVLTQQPPSTVATPQPPSTPGATQPSAQETGSGKTAPFQLVLNGAKISDGSLSIRDATGAVKADLQGVRASADTSGYYNGQNVTGKLSIATIALPQNLRLTDFSTPFAYHAGAVKADPFEARAFGGKVTGDYKLDPSAPSLLDINATGIDVAEIGHAANPHSSTTLSGSLALQSKWHGVETGRLTGEGDAQITDGKLAGVSVLHELSGLLQVRGLSEPELKSVTVHFEVAGGSTRFSRLNIESPIFEITGDGVIDANGGLDAHLVLTLHGSAMGGVTGAAASLISKIPGGGGSIPLHLTGTVSNPKTNLSSSILNPAPKAEKAIDRAVKHLF